MFCGIASMPRQFARGDAGRLAAYEEPERLEASGLGKGRKSGDSQGRIHPVAPIYPDIYIARIYSVCHISRITDMCDRRTTVTQAQQAHSSKGG